MASVTEFLPNPGLSSAFSSLVESTKELVLGTTSPLSCTEITTCDGDDGDNRDGKPKRQVT